MHRRWLCVTLLVACGSDAPPTTIDPAADFSCAGKSRVMTAPDPLHVSGTIIDATGGNGIGGAPWEITNADSGVVLASGITDDSSLPTRGSYGANIPTGGKPLHIYRRFLPTGNLETLVWDGWAQYAEFTFVNPVIGAAFAEFQYSLVGRTDEATQAMMVIVVADCTPVDVPAHLVIGATVDPPPGANVIYVDDDGHPDVTLSSTGALGQAVVLGIKPGIVDVAVHAGDITYRSWPIAMRAHTFTWSPRRP